MKTISVQHLENNQPLSVHDLCYLIYQGFGQWGVEEFAHRILSKENLGLVWLSCSPCENVEPFIDNACLICSTEYKCSCGCEDDQ
jgi:hypothetical protein